MSDVDNEALEPAGTDEPDVLLHVPEVRVEEISLDVEDLRARVSLQADVLQLLKLHVGVEVELGRVDLTIKGVEAKALLKVRLDNVARIVDRVLTTLDNNPDMVERLLEHVDETLEEAPGILVDDVAEAVRPSRPKPEPSEKRRRHSRTDSPGTRPAKGPRGRRSEEE
jgi:hypothetical protein